MFIALFLTRLLSAVYFGVYAESVSPYPFFTIPVALLLAITAGCMYNSGDKKCAKGIGGQTYFAVMVAYNFLWMMAIKDYDEYVYEAITDDYYGWSSFQERRIDIQGLLLVLSVNIFLDTYINRKWLRKMGAKMCMGSETRATFKKIKMAKKQKKWLKDELDDLHERAPINEDERKLVQGIKARIMGCKMGQPLDKQTWIQFKQQCNQKLMQLKMSQPRYGSLGNPSYGNQYGYNNQGISNYT